MKTLKQQIDCVKREIAIRKNIYPKWIGSKMSADKCRHEIECMECVLDTLEKLHKVIPPDQPDLFTADTHENN